MIMKYPLLDVSHRFSPTSSGTPANRCADGGPSRIITCGSAAANAFAVGELRFTFQRASRCDGFSRLWLYIGFPIFLSDGITTGLYFWQVFSDDETRFIDSTCCRCAFAKERAQDPAKFGNICRRRRLRRRTSL